MGKVDENKKQKREALLNTAYELFTIVELAGSAGYNSILYQEPLPIEEYKTFLYRTVRLIIESHRITTKEEAVS